ncbi:MAG: ATP-binding protein [Parvibaculum sp.]
MTRKTKIDATEMAAIVREAVNRLPGGFIIYGPDHEILLANDQNERDFPIANQCLRAGLSHREAICAAVKDAMPGYSNEEVKEAADRLVTALTNSEPVELRTATGKIMQVIELPLSFGGSVGVGADITALRDRERELKKARKAAEAANEAKSAFLANISHEIRTPLNAILGMTQVLAGSDLNEEQRDQIETILDSGKTLMAILNDVLDLSKIEAGRFDISPIDTDLEQQLHRLSKLWVPRAAEKGLVLKIEVDPEMVTYLRFDLLRVRQCLSNLVSNAIKFTDHGAITISARSDRLGDGVYEVRLTVSDTGMGMKAETLERLFAPFTQADAAIANQYGGTGLGLSISRKLARLMGGDITVTSEEGKGSTFTLTFHCLKGQDAMDKIDQPEGDKPNGPRWADGLAILLVDDHPLNRKVAKLFLEPMGITVVEAENGKDALTMLSERHFDLVLLDRHMPVMDGPETLRRIRAKGSGFEDIPVIVLTADTLHEALGHQGELDADGMLQKPIDHRDLLLEICRVLEKKHGRAPMPREPMPDLRRA